MATIRKPFQGVWNIVRFNWHFYVLASLALLLILLLNIYTNSNYQLYLLVLSLLILNTTFISLAVSYYVYDVSDLYKLNWLKTTTDTTAILNINAGFDETSILLKEKFSHAALTVLDFYDPLKHTAVSIKRARKAYPPYPNSKQVETAILPLADNSMDRIFSILAAHEIRNEAERIRFFKELKRVVKPNGQIFITEHLRDTANMLAYNIGFLHFHSRNTWLHTFKSAGLNIQQEIKTTPFITTFILEKNGAAS